MHWVVKKQDIVEMTIRSVELQSFQVSIIFRCKIETRARIRSMTYLCRLTDFA